MINYLRILLIWLPTARAPALADELYRIDGDIKEKPPFLLVDLASSNPQISARHAFSSNIIDIGHLIITKYAIGNIKLTKTSMVNGKLPWVRPILSAIGSIIQLTTKKLPMITIPNFLGRLSPVIAAPLALIKTSLPKYFTGFSSANNLAARATVAKNNHILDWLKLKRLANTSNIPTDNTSPNPKAKFQRLSRLIRVFSNCIGVFYQNLYSSIVACLSPVAKVIVLSLGILGECAAEDTSHTNIHELIKSAELEYQIPSGLLASIAKIESHYNPYAVNIAGRAFMPHNASQAERIIANSLTSGIRNFDVGIMQLNYHWHGKHFANVSNMLVPENNIAYAAKLLKNLYTQHGSWHKAVRFYHSATPLHHKRYSRQVIVAWLNSNTNNFPSLINQGL